MKKHIKAAFICLFIGVCTLLQAQTNTFRMVGTVSGSWTGSNPYTATINFQSDQTGGGYFPTQIPASGYRMITSTEQVFLVTKNSANAVSGNFTVTLYGGSTGAPLGQVMIYDPGTRFTVPECPTGNTGSSTALAAAITTYNSRMSSDFRQSNGAPLAAPSGALPQELARDTSAAGDNNIYRWTGAAWVLVSGGGAGDASTLLLNPAFDQDGDATNETTVQGALESLRIYGAYANDAAAAAASVPLGGLYILSSANTVGSKIGSITTRQN